MRSVTRALVLLVILLSACSRPSQTTTSESIREGASLRDAPLRASIVSWSADRYGLITGGERIPVAHVLLRLENTSGQYLRVNLDDTQLQISAAANRVQFCEQLPGQKRVFHLAAGQAEFVELFFLVPRDVEGVDIQEVSLRPGPASGFRILKTLGQS